MGVVRLNITLPNHKWTLAKKSKPQILNFDSAFQKTWMKKRICHQKIHTRTPLEKRKDGSICLTNKVKFPNIYMLKL